MDLVMMVVVVIMMMMMMYNFTNFTIKMYVWYKSFRWHVCWMWRTGPSGFWPSLSSTSSMDLSGEIQILKYKYWNTNTEIQIQACLLHQVWIFQVKCKYMNVDKTQTCLASQLKQCILSQMYQRKLKCQIYERIQKLFWAKYISRSKTKYSRPRFHEREVFPSHREVVMIQNNGKNRSSDADDHDLFEYFFFFSFLIFTWTFF